MAYCLDEAVSTFGSHVEAEVKKVKDKAKNEKVGKTKADHKLRQLLGMPLKFADPANYKK